MSPRLSMTDLAQLDRRVARPDYDSAELSVGIVHLGIGAFHRAHQAMFTDRAVDVASGGWGIAGVTQRSTRVVDQLEPQDGLYTVQLRDGSADSSARVVGSVRDVLFAGASPDAVARRIADPAVRIVSSTVTEKGYAADVGTRRLRLDDPDVARDLADDRPHRSVIGQLAAGFSRRAAAGGDRLTVLCCDNVVRGGELVGELCQQFLGAWTSGAAGETVDWVRRRVRFPDTLVDRIVPATTEDDGAAFTDRFGYRDDGLVLTEPFGLWVIADDFAAGHPDWPEQVRLVTDVAPWSAVKLRMLNGTHSLLAYLGLLLGEQTMSSASSRTDLARLAEHWLDEAQRSLGERAAAVDVVGYRAAVLPRLRNTGIVHRLAQIAMDGSVKLPARTFPTAVDLLSHGEDAPLSALTLAAWVACIAGDDVDDPDADRLRAAVDGVEARKAVENVLGENGVVPVPDALQGHFLDEVAGSLEALRRDGAEAVAGRAVAAGGSA